MSSHQSFHSSPTRRSSDLVLEQAEKGISLRVDEDAVVLVARPVQELERHIHAPEARRDDGECGRLHILPPCPGDELVADRDRKSTRLNSSHLGISYAVFCL